MSNNTPDHLFLLAEHLKLSLLERQRALTLNLEPHKQDAHITRTLSTLHAGLDALETQQSDLGQAEDPSSALSRLRHQYETLYSQFHGSAPPPAESQHPNDAALAPTFSQAAQSRRPKNVRFHDNPYASDDDENRAALFPNTNRYHDSPEQSELEQSELNNAQLHAHHSAALREQDAQLDVLSHSIGRQRALGMEMGTELEAQNLLLEDVEGGVDRHSTTLGRARRRLGFVARKAEGGWSWVTIGILVLVLVLLIVVLK